MEVNSIKFASPKHFTGPKLWTAVQEVLPQGKGRIKKRKKTTQRHLKNNIAMMSILNLSNSYKPQAKRHYELHDYTWTVPSIVQPRPKHPEVQSIFNIKVWNLSRCGPKVTDRMEIILVFSTLTLNFSSRYFHIWYSFRFSLQFKSSSAEQLIFRQITKYY